MSGEPLTILVSETGPSKRESCWANLWRASMRPAGCTPRPRLNAARATTVAIRPVCRQGRKNPL